MSTEDNREPLTSLTTNTTAMAINYTTTTLTTTQHEVDIYSLTPAELNTLSVSQRYNELALIAHGAKAMLTYVFAFSVAESINAAAKESCAAVWRWTEEANLEYRLAALIRDKGDAAVMALCDEYLAMYH